MAAKVPTPAGTHALAGDWQATIPYISAGTTIDAVKAGQLRPPDLVLPFQPESSDYDIDTGDTYTIPAANRVISFAWMPGNSATVSITFVRSTGVFTFIVGSGPAAGWLLVWLDSV